MNSSYKDWKKDKEELHKILSSLKTKQLKDWIKKLTDWLNGDIRKKQEEESGSFGKVFLHLDDTFTLLEIVLLEQELKLRQKKEKDL